LLSTLNAAAARQSRKASSRTKRRLATGQKIRLALQRHFVEVARKVGIDHPVLYGSQNPKNYILESIGCGCAFLDYDNDGWVDILVLAATDSWP